LPATYLAGGVAVAVHLGHRRSRDLDLFTYGDAVSIEPFRALTAEADVELVAATRGSARARPTSITSPAHSPSSTTPSAIRCSPKG